MAGVLVFAEHHDGAFTAGTLGLMHEAARLAGELGASADAVVCGSGLEAGLAASLGRHGAAAVLVCDADALGSGLAQPIVDAVAEVVRQKGHTTVLLGASVVASDVAAALCARLDAGLVVDAVELHAEGGRVVARRPGLGDSVYAHCAPTSDVGVFVVRANTFAPGEASGGDAAVEQVAVTVQPWSQAARLAGHETAERTGVDITQADVLVAGGRGLGKPENFSLAEGLASALGGEVAATRAVVDAGWYPYSAQVGQTGKTVAPKLYIALGISGAIQHKVGMAGAEVIVAINRDPNAPIFDFADLGVVGDVTQVVPRLTELLRARG
jgi:electron transfer flavoprotein alpha subunit